MWNSKNTVTINANNLMKKVLSKQIICPSTVVYPYGQIMLTCCLKTLILSKMDAMPGHI